VDYFRLNRLVIAITVGNFHKQGAGRNLNPLEATFLGDLTFSLQQS